MKQLRFRSAVRISLSELRGVSLRWISESTAFTDLGFGRSGHAVVAGHSVFKRRRLRKIGERRDTSFCGLLGEGGNVNSGCVQLVRFLHMYGLENSAWGSNSVFVFAHGVVFAEGTAAVFGWRLSLIGDFASTMGFVFAN